MPLFIQLHTIGLFADIFPFILLHFMSIACLFHIRVFRTFIQHHLYIVYYIVGPVHVAPKED